MQVVESCTRLLRTLAAAGVVCAIVVGCDRREPARESGPAGRAAGEAPADQAPADDAPASETEEEGGVGSDGGEAAGATSDDARAAEPGGDRVAAPPAARPEPMPMLLRQALALVESGQLGPARDLAAHHLKRDPGDGRAAFVIGLTYHRAGNHGPAVGHFERALELSPEYALTHRYYGECLLMLGELEVARREYEAWREAEPLEPMAHYSIGLVDLEEARLDEAEARFRRAIELFGRMGETRPGEFEARTAARAKCHARLADVHFARDEYGVARDELVESTRIEPRNISALFTLSQVYRRLGEPERAAEALERYESAKRAVIEARRGGGG